MAKRPTKPNANETMVPKCSRVFTETTLSMNGRRINRGVAVPPAVGELSQGEILECCARSLDASAVDAGEDLE